MNHQMTGNMDQAQTTGNMDQAQTTGNMNGNMNLTRKQRDFNNFIRKSCINTIFYGNSSSPLYNSLKGHQKTDTLMTVLNSHHCVVIIAERMFIIPKLSLYRWKYFQTSSKYNSQYFYDVTCFDITKILIDSDSLSTLKYDSLDRFGVFINNAHYDDMYSSKECLQMKTFLSLLIPPHDFWKVSS